MTRGVHQIHEIGFVVEVVVHGDSLGLDGYSPFPFDFEFVEVLGLRVGGDGVSDLEKPIGQGALAVVDVRNDAEISDGLWRVLYGDEVFQGPEHYYYPP